MDFDRKKLGDVRKNPDEIIKLIRNKDKDFMKYMETFESKEEIKDVLKKNYDIAIYTVGLSIYPLLFSLKVANPNEKAIFFYTDKSVMFKEVFEVFSKVLGLKFEMEHKLLKKSSDTAEMYNEIERTLRRFKNKHIAIDITGGKKPTIAAGFFGASIHKENNNIDILYMDFTEYVNDVPVYGTEFITILLNPNEIFSAVERKTLKKLFDSNQFRAARKFSKEIRDRLRLISKKFSDYDIKAQLEDVEKIYYFAKLYENRNDFNYERCEINERYLTYEEIRGIEELKKAYEKIGKIKRKLYDLGYTGPDFNKRFAEYLFDEFHKDRSGIYIALDRYISALRYKNIDYQNYILRLVSVLEMAGIVFTEGKAVRLEEKLKNIPDKNIKVRLNNLRRKRNDLSLVHGFGVVDCPDVHYESAVLEYVCQAFDTDKEELDKIMETDLKFRTFEEI